MGRGWAQVALVLLTGAAGGYLVARMTLQVPASITSPAGPVDQAAAKQLAERPAGRRAGGPASDPAVVPGDDPGGAEIPADTLNGILRLDSDFAQTAALYRLVDGVDHAELERLIAEADSVPGASDRRAALSILYARYADLDPEAALDFLQRQNGAFIDTELRAVFHAWSRMDLMAAVEAAAALPLAMRQTAGSAILFSRDGLLPEAQRDIARRLEIEHVLPRIAMLQTMDAVDRDPVTAWQAALAEGNNAMQQQRLAGIAQGWARQDPLAAMNAVASLGNAALRGQLQTQILHEWGRREPQQAVDWALAQPLSPQRQQLTTMALSAMAEVDPRMALELARNLEGRESDHAVGSVLSRWAASDPVAAARAIDAITSPEARQRAIGRVVSAYAGQDPAGAIQWISGLNAEESVLATMQAFSTLAGRDPSQAATLISRLTDQRSRGLAAGTVASAWARTDPREAARWVDSLTDPEMRTQAGARLVGQWASFDMDAAVSYAESIPAVAERDAALVSIIQHRGRDVETAERLFERLTQPAQRRAAARQLYYRMQGENPQRAEYYRELAGIEGNPAAIRR